MKVGDIGEPQLATLEADVARQLGVDPEIWPEIWSQYQTDYPRAFVSWQRQTYFLRSLQRGILLEDWRMPLTQVKRFWENRQVQLSRVDEPVLAPHKQIAAANVRALRELLAPRRLQTPVAPEEITQDPRLLNESSRLIAILEELTRLKELQGLSPLPIDSPLASNQSVQFAREKEKGVFNKVSGNLRTFGHVYAKKLHTELCRVHQMVLDHFSQYLPKGETLTVPTAIYSGEARNIWFNQLIRFALQVQGYHTAKILEERRLTTMPIPDHRHLFVVLKMENSLAMLTRARKAEGYSEVFSQGVGLLRKIYQAYIEAAQTNQWNLLVETVTTYFESLDAQSRKINLKEASPLRIWARLSRSSKGTGTLQCHALNCIKAMLEGTASGLAEELATNAGDLKVAVHVVRLDGKAETVQLLPHPPDARVADVPAPNGSNGAAAQGYSLLLTMPGAPVATVIEPEATEQIAPASTASSLLMGGVMAALIGPTANPTGVR